jgi:predicted ATPase/DNA-binding SARP family transcriptional activator
MSAVRLCLLGPPRLERDGKPVELDTRKTVALVAYLAMTGQKPGGETHTREALATLLWPEMEPQRGRANLRRSLSVLRKGIGGDFLVADRETIGTKPDPGIWLDVAHFRRLLNSPRVHGHPEAESCPKCLEALAEAVELYRGDFLEGFSLRDSASFDDWQFFQTEGLRQELARALERLVHGHSAQGMYEQAILYGRRWVALDPLHEPAQRELMQLYALEGQRAAALRQYAECARILEAELGLPPSEETTSLYERIRTSPAIGEEPIRPAARPRHTLLGKRYRLDAEIGRGGMAVVYRGYDTLLERHVAVKILSKTTLDSESRARLLREAQAAARLNHPNIASIHDAGETEGIPFIVIELVEGPSLHDRPLGDLEEIVDLACQVCAALDHAHAHGIIHRDLKPENVLLAPGGTAKLVDFGLARTVASRLTAEGAVLGTPFYLSPEQAMGQDIDHRADLYALGVMLYELTAGQLPFGGRDPLTVIAQHLHSPVVPPTTHNATIPAALDSLIVQLLSKRPEDRPASAAEVGQALKAVVRPEAPAGLPPPPTTRQQPQRRHNLPAQPTPFIGRQAQLAVVRETLGRPEVRLLTLTGPGGTGKTRLALQAAGDLLDEFEDGVFFVALAPIRDPSFLLPAIGHTLGIRETTDRALLEQLADELQDKRALLVLDNFEQIADAAPLVSDLLGAASPLKVLVTSRTLLHLYGEHSYPVPPMALPDPQDLPDLERLRQTEVVRLFTQRAQAVKPGFVLSDENAAAVIGICTRLDGLPLAIELAAARVRLLPPQAILTRLADRFRFLTGGSRDLPARHQTLRAAIDWSYDLLQAEEKALFRRLAVFVGGCSLEAAEAVCCGSGELDVLEGLQGLVDKNLALCSDVQGEPRFLMLETVREYALEQLAASGGNEAEEIRGQHASFFVALAEGAERELWGADQAAWTDRLDLEHDNLRAALEWSLQRGAADPGAAETGLRLAGPLWKFWHDRAYLKEGRRWLERALDCPLGQGSARARVLVAAGTMAWQLGDYAKARSYFEQGAAGCREVGDNAGLAEALHLDGHLALDEGEHTQARALFQESLRLYQEMGEASISLVLTQDLALLAYHQGAFEEARVQFEAGLAASRELGQEDLTGTTLNRLGELARLRGDDDEAAALFEEGLTLSRELQLKPEIPSFLKNLGHVARCRGDYEQARALFAESLALQQEHGNKQGMAESLAGLASVAAQPECAVQLFAAVETLLDAVGAPLSPADRADLDRNLAAVSAQLDVAAIAAAWAEGQALAADASATAWQRTVACALQA